MLALLQIQVNGGTYKMFFNKGNIWKRHGFY